MTQPNNADQQRDPFELERFVQAQEMAYTQVLAELHSGRKRSHWMWFIFPQIAGLGFSLMSQRYAIKTRAEAEAYLTHPILGQRLIACAGELLEIKNRSALEIFGSPDDMKLKSSMTLFAAVSASPSVFNRVLDAYFHGQRDQRTLELLASRV